MISLAPIQYPISMEILNLIKGTPIDTNDKAIWKLSNNGYFYRFTAFENLRYKLLLLQYTII